MSVNRVFLIGRLGADPELRHTKGGTAVVNLRMATNFRRKNGDEWEEQTEWHDVTVWGRTAENVEKFCTKGKQIFVEGRLQTREWEDREGNPRRVTEIVAETVRFLGSKADDAVMSDGNHSAKPSPSAQGAGYSAAAPSPYTETPQDGDIPF